MRQVKEVIAEALALPVAAGSQETVEAHRAGIIEDAIRDAGYVILGGVTLYGDTSCPHCLGDPTAPEWNESIAGEDGLCACCLGAGEVVVLSYAEVTDPA